MNQFDKVLRDFSPLVAPHSSLAQTKLDILLNVQPGEQRCFLEQQYAIRTGTANLFPVCEDASAARRFQTGDNTEER